MYSSECVGLGRTSRNGRAEGGEYVCVLVLETLKSCQASFRSCLTWPTENEQEANTYFRRRGSGQRRTGSITVVDLVWRLFGVHESGRAGTLAACDWLPRLRAPVLKRAAFETDGDHTTPVRPAST
jgi:hypothetical protein